MTDPKSGRTDRRTPLIDSSPLVGVPRQPPGCGATFLKLFVGALGPSMTGNWLGRVERRASHRPAVGTRCCPGG
jgi:hypothetical protein